MTTDEQRANDAAQRDKIGLNRDDPSQDFVDQSKIDFDPDDGLYSGTAVDGTTEIEGPHIDAETGELSGMDEARQQAQEQHEQNSGGDSER